MNQSQLLAKKYGLPESRDVILDNLHPVLAVHKTLPLNRDIAALMTLALEHGIFYKEYKIIHDGITAYKDYKAFNVLYDDHPTKVDALCECLCQALLAE